MKIEDMRNHLQMFELLLENSLLSQSLCHAFADRPTCPPGIILINFYLVAKIFDNL